MHEAEVADAHNVGIAEFLGKKMMRYGQPIANFTWMRPEIECRGESCIRPAPRPHWAITRIALTEEDACN